MDYKNLSLQEKMARAEEYCLLFKDEIKLPEQVIDEVASMFDLNYEQATKAYTNSKEKYRTEYRKAGIQKFSSLGVSFLACLAVAGFYFAMGNDTGFWFVIIIAFLFIIGALSLFHFAANTALDNFIVKKPWLRPLQKNFIITIFFYVLIFFIYAGYQHFWGEMLDYNNIEQRTYLLKENVEYKSTKGRSRSYYYYFSFTSFEKEFRLWKKEYKYIPDTDYIDSLKKGDSVTICILKGDVASLHTESFFNKTNRIVNVIKDGYYLIDFDKRNKAEQENRTTLLVYAALALIANTIIVVHVIKKTREKYLVQGLP